MPLCFSLLYSQDLTGRDISKYQF